MEHYKEGQYDDDLTVGIDDYDEDFDTGGVDLFDYVGDEESPLARLKSLVLSIDWEITDDILRQFNEELLDLKDIWHGNKVNLIYVQALEKISRYIYKEKSSAHPNAIKLLLTFYTNLEKIVSDEEMSDQVKKEILLEDIQRFERLKKVIAPKAEEKEDAPAVPLISDDSPAVEPAAEIEEPIVPAPEGVAEPVGASAEVEEDEAALQEDTEPDTSEVVHGDSLLNLKAIVYGIDWEITERDLANLGKEVKLLEKEYKSSKAKLIFLQGIGSLGAYINLKRSDAHADAFRLLHSFYTGLETVVRKNLTGQAEKDILMPQVEKFNKFKAAVADTISPEAMAKSSVAEEEKTDEYDDSDIQPAFADVPEDVHGFKEEEEIAAIEKKEQEDSVDVYFDEDAEDDLEVDDSELASEMESRLSGMFEEPDESAAKGLAADIALQGVDVESEADDESDEEPLPEENGELAPALASEETPDDESPAVFADKVEDFFGEPEVDEGQVLGEPVPGVDVEHEADDDSDEEPLPFEDGEFAPALSTGDEIGAGADTEFADDAVTGEAEVSEIDSNLDDFFGKEEIAVEISEAVEEATAGFEDETRGIAGSTAIASETDVEDKLADFFGDEDAEVFSAEDDALQGVAVEHEADDETEEEPLAYEDGELAPALSTEEDQFDGESAAEVMAVDEQIESSVSESIDDLFDERADEELEIELADDTADSDIDSRLEELGLEEREEEVSPDEALLGVDVETEDDDDSEEEPLLFEDDGEFAPALSSDEEFDFKAEEKIEEGAEDVADQFDAIFGDDQPSDTAIKDSADLQDTADSDSGERDAVLDESDDADAAVLEPETFGEVAFEEAGFEEIAEDDLEEIPLEAIAELDEESVPSVSDQDMPEMFQEAEDEELSDDEEILAMLEEDAGDEQDMAPAFAGEAIDSSEAEIPELSPDELEAVLLEGTDVTAAGDIPAGYPSERELSSEFGEVAGDGEFTHPEGNEDFIISVEKPDDFIDDDEVIFEAVEEESYVGDEEPLGDVDDLEVDEDQTFGTTLLTEEQAVAEEGVLGTEVVEEEQIDLTDEAEEKAGGADSAYIAPHFEEKAADTLSGLRSCIVSLGLEIDDRILSGLTEEIEKLRHEWLDKPAERTFIQLLSTVAAHIEKYRYEADPQANKLLLSVLDKLELCSLDRTDSSLIQEALLSETSKILEWQQKLIDRKPTEEDVEIGREQKEYESAEESQAPTDEKVERDISVAFDDMSKQIDAIGNELLMEKVSSIMRSELEQLKSAFHAELKELKDEILRGNK